MHVINVFMVTKKKEKVDDSFLVSQLNVEGFSTPFRLDRKKMVAEALFYIFVATLSLHN